MCSEKCPYLITACVYFGGNWLASANTVSCNKLVVNPAIAIQVMVILK